jgi:enamine deaminase RidA (YjgF/YER057c/UK114 family)
MPKQSIHPAGLQKPPTYSHVVKAGDTVHISGQVALDEQGNLVGRGDIEAQAVRVFENLKLALASVNATFDDVVKLTMFITDARYRDTLRTVRAHYLKDPYPASTLLVVAGLAMPELLLEIEATAYLGE